MINTFATQNKKALTLPEESAFGDSQTFKCLSAPTSHIFVMNTNTISRNISPPASFRVLVSQLTPLPRVICDGQPIFNHHLHLQSEQLWQIVGYYSPTTVSDALLASNGDHSHAFIPSWWPLRADQSGAVIARTCYPNTQWFRPILAIVWSPNLFD